MTMKTARVLFVVAGTFALAAGHACPADSVMGLWEGLLKDAGDDYAVEMAVVQEPGGALWALLRIGDREGRLQGQREADAGVLIGSVPREEDGGKRLVMAHIDGGTLSGTMQSDDGNAGSRTHFTLHRAHRESPAAGTPPPDGAVVLFDGSGLDEWDLLPGNMTDGGVLRVNGNYYSSKWEFGDARIHIEFRTPFVPYLPTGQRGNSGVYVQGRYELQILDSFGAEPSLTGCGAIYGFAEPLVQACLPPNAWQTYEITFRAPRLNEQGEAVAHPRITVLLNGFLIHDDLELPRVTPGWVYPDAGPLGPIVLQNHESEVQFRNIWVLPLGEGDGHEASGR